MFRLSKAKLPFSRATSRKLVFALRTDPGLAHDGDRQLAGLLALAYAGLGLAGGALAYFFAGHAPFAHPSPWIEMPQLASVSASVAIGVAFAFAVVVATRITVTRFTWARRLHLELQPVARRFDRQEIWLVAILSSVGEELFFRSFLVPVCGLVVSTILFGLLHQVRGPSRWVWAAWAGAVGLGLGAIFAATGSVLGPIVAHALINATNLAFLKHYDVE